MDNKFTIPSDRSFFHQMMPFLTVGSLNSKWKIMDKLLKINPQWKKYKLKTRKHRYALLSIDKMAEILFDKSKMLDFAFERLKDVAVAHSNLGEFCDVLKAIDSDVFTETRECSDLCKLIEGAVDEMEAIKARDLSNEKSKLDTDAKIEALSNECFKLEKVLLGKLAWISEGVKKYLNKIKDHANVRSANVSKLYELTVDLYYGVHKSTHNYAANMMVIDRFAKTIASNVLNGNSIPQAHCIVNSDMNKLQLMSELSDEYKNDDKKRLGYVISSLDKIKMMQTTFNSDCWNIVIDNVNKCINAFKDPKRRLYTADKAFGFGAHEYERFLDYCGLKSTMDPSLYYEDADEIVNTVYEDAPQDEIVTYEEEDVYEAPITPREKHVEAVIDERDELFGHAIPLDRTMVESKVKLSARDSVEYKKLSKLGRDCYLRCAQEFVFNDFNLRKYETWLKKYIKRVDDRLWGIQNMNYAISSELDLHTKFAEYKRILNNIISCLELDRSGSGERETVYKWKLIELYCLDRYVVKLGDEIEGRSMEKEREVRNERFTRSNEHISKEIRFNSVPKTPFVPKDTTDVHYLLNTMTADDY